MTDRLLSSFDPGPLRLKSRIVMAWLTRSRSRQPAFASPVTPQAHEAPEFEGNATREAADPRGTAIMAMIRAASPGPIVACGAYAGPMAAAALSEGRADLIAFGLSFLANPDLSASLHAGASPNLPAQATQHYGGGRQDDIDYPTPAQVLGNSPLPDGFCVAADLLAGR